jgi:hypothetical protein
VFVVSLPLMTMADVPGQYGANNLPMETFSGSAGSPGCVVIEMASKPIVFFLLSTREYSSRITLSKLFYCFK